MALCLRHPSSPANSLLNTIAYMNIDCQGRHGVKPDPSTQFCTKEICDLDQGLLKVIEKRTRRVHTSTGEPSRNRARAPLWRIDVSKRDATE